ncbi:adenylate/guanylate cyclase domain-containing protein [Variovorax paradoxus]|nr:adenylate/guanylate cyclase domain-containing protein [Variovorax paradoxus]MBT2301532.1 adenylate/guanylate cyclase domain-containing protein [Variovorax paradoxus]
MNITVEAPAAWPRAAIPQRVLAPWPLVDGGPVPGGLSPQRFAHLLEEVEALLFSVRQPSSETAEDDRALLTLMFTDIVDSSGHAQRLGDEAWSRLLERHHAIVRTQLAACRGREIDTAGDGFFASFDMPARAVRCALAIRNALQAIGIGIRIGLHTGECERLGDKVAGLAVHVAARIAACAATGEIVVSGTVRDLVMGSGLRFSGGECHALKGLCDEWRLYRVCGDEHTATNRDRGAKPGLPGRCARTR